MSIHVESLDPHGCTRTFGFGSVVALCLVISVFPILAPGAPTEDDPGGVSVERALAHVEFIAQEPHVMGTPEIERVREYLIETLTGVGLEPETLTVETPDYFGAPGGTVAGHFFGAGET